jgi:hypothetical protein
MSAALLVACLGIVPALAASPAQAPAGAKQHPAAAGPEHLFGAYLAGRHAQQLRDFTAAAGSYEKAIAADPDAPELISRTFLMEVCVGHFDPPVHSPRRS